MRSASFFEPGPVERVSGPSLAGTWPNKFQTKIIIFVSGLIATYFYLLPNGRHADPWGGSLARFWVLVPASGSRLGHEVALVFRPPHPQPLEYKRARQGCLSLGSVWRASLGARESPPRASLGPRGVSGSSREAGLPGLYKNQYLNRCTVPGC